MRDKIYCNTGNMGTPRPHFTGRIGTPVRECWKRMRVKDARYQGRKMAAKCSLSSS